VVERKSWSIREDGNQIRQSINRHLNLSFVDVSPLPVWSLRDVVHFGSQFMFEYWFKLLPRLDNVVVTFFHGNFGDSPDIDKNLNFLLQNQAKIRVVVTSNKLMKERLERFGVMHPKIVVIPIGLDLNTFFLRNEQQRKDLREALGIPQDCFVIGSFQKDGVGWGEGTVPKLIKGPDIFVETTRLINLQTPVFVLLSGPSRGYVINKLSNLGIPYKHIEMKHVHQIASLYHALDAYIVSSREEGGPKGLLEALASGIPVASTPVGMTSELLNFSNFLQVTSDYRPCSLSEAILRIKSQEIHVDDRANLRNLVRDCGWDTVALSHLKDVYLPLMQRFS
jgi:glycosyltransferase involved in cell wall biosynthesis